MANNAHMSEENDLVPDYNWGGEGSNLNEPVRAHVLAALVPTDQPYPPPVDELLTIGEPTATAQAKIAQLGLAQEHVPDLVRMARDRGLNTAMDDTKEVWAPIHALEALENLDVGEHVADLIPLFDVDSEWFGENLPDVLKRGGAAALEPLRAYVQDASRWIYGRTYALGTFTPLVELHPELRGRAIQILSDALDQASENDPYVNADLIVALVELKAVEALPAIRRAFEQDLVDESVMGDWAEVLDELGQQPDPEDPLVQRSRERWDARREQMRAQIPGELSHPQAGRSKPKQSQAAKKKNKRKQSAASRKANKRKKRK
jgi:hypothetical protein